MLKQIRREMRSLADPERALHAGRFFRTGPGEYGEGDVFLGLSVPQTRLLARKFRGAPIAVCRDLLDSRLHEERLLALLLMVHAFAKGDTAVRKSLFKEYLRRRGRVNNWDLVDTSAPAIVGGYLLEEGGLDAHPELLPNLAASKSLWDRRIALLATFRFIKAGRFDWTLRLAERLLGDREDLIHKAAGWMLREVGGQDRAALEAFLRRHCRDMPRTMLRYSLEKLPPALRRSFMERKHPPG